MNHRSKDPRWSFSVIRLSWRAFKRISSWSDPFTRGFRDLEKLLILASSFFLSASLNSFTKQASEMIEVTSITSFSYLSWRIMFKRKDFNTSRGSSAFLHNCIISSLRVWFTQTFFFAVTASTKEFSFFFRTLGSSMASCFLYCTQQCVHRAGLPHLVSTVWPQASLVGKTARQLKLLRWHGPDRVCSQGRAWITGSSHGGQGLEHGWE